jgi:hypothetical protein
VIVTGDVARSIDELVDCGTPAGNLIFRAGARGAGAFGSYVWRREGGSLRRIPLRDDRVIDAKTSAMGLQGGDIVVVE